MEEKDAFQLVPVLKANYPDLKIIMYTMHALERYYRFFTELNVDGYVLKSGEYGNIIEALEVVSRGEKFLQSSVDSTEMAVEENQIQFNKIEKHILDLLSRDLSNYEISKTLGLDSRKVMDLRKNLLVKTGCANTKELLALYAS